MKKFYLVFSLLLTLMVSYGQTVDFDSNDIEILKAIRDNAPADSPIKTLWSDESQVGTWAGVSWDDSNPARVTDLDLDSQKLTILNVKGLSKLQTLWCPANQLSSLDLSGLANLEAMECIDNQLTSLNLSGLTKLDFIRCENNQLTSLNVSSLTSLSTLNCSNNLLSSLDVSGLTNISYLETEGNKIPFSHLPLPNSSFTSYQYSPQNKVFEINEVPVEQEIDYSSEATIDGTGTKFSWYKNGALIVGTTQSGKYTPTEPGDFYCKMTNAKFPGLTLISNTVTVMASTPEFDPNDISVLKAIRDNAPSDSPLKTEWADETQIRTWIGLGWDNSSPKRVFNLTLNSQNLTNLNLSGLSNLKIIDCKNNNLTSLNVSGLDSLKALYCDNNRLTSLNLDGLTNIKYLFDYDNNIPFSQLPLPNSSFIVYQYSQQNKIFEEKEIPLGQAIDYSSEALIDGTATQFSWFKDSVLILGTDQTGKYTPTEAGVYNCEMTNPKFPGLTLTTNNVTVVAPTPEFDPNDVVILKAIRDNAPADSPLKTEWADETKIGSWAGVTWDNSTPKRVSFLAVRSKKIMSLDVVKLSNLKGLDCADNQIILLNVSGLKNLLALDCPLNKISSLNLSTTTNLQSFNCISNLLTSLDLTALTNLETLFCSANQLTSINLSGLTSLRHVYCQLNQLKSIDVTGLNTIKFLTISDNNIPFSNMPLPNSSYSEYVYKPQNKIFEAKEISTGEEIDYSSEALIDGTATQFSWFKDSVLILGTDQTGKYTPTEAGDYYCEMTNAKFPGLTLTTNNVAVTGITTGPVLKLVSTLSGTVIPASNVSYRLFLKTNTTFSSEDLIPVIEGDTTIFSVSEGEWIVLATSNQTPQVFLPTYSGNVVDWSSAESISASGQESVLKEISCVLPDSINNGSGQISGNIYENNNSGTKSISIIGANTETGNPISGALIQLFKNGGTIPAFTVFSDSVGYYEFDALEAGNYEIAVEIPGFVQSGKFPVSLSDNSPSVSITFGVNSNTREITNANQLQDLTFKIYPNPNNGKFTIEGDQTINSIEIFNLSGEKIFSKKGSLGEAKLYFDLSSQAKGIYLLKIVNGKEAYSAKLLIK